MIDPTPQSTDPLGALTPKQRAFVDHYVACGFNATEAARRAGYKDPEQAGYENKKKQEVQAAIESALAVQSMPRSEVLARLTAHARADVRELFRFAEQDVTSPEGRVIVPAGTVLGLRLHRDAPLHLIKSITPTRYGDKIELYDAQAALVKLGEAHGIFRDRIADGLDAVAAAARSLEQKLLPDVGPGPADGVPGAPDPGGEGGAAL